MRANSGSRPVIGLSANVLEADSERELYGGRPLLYLEQSMGTWVMRAGARPYLVPFAPEGESVETPLPEMVDAVDGLLLQGGADIAPQSYGAEPIEGVSGRVVRDRYEAVLIEAALERDVPILGVCRGMQMLNVYFGGTLVQDIDRQRPGAAAHRDRQHYDDHTHRVEFCSESRLARRYPESGGAIVSVHHQAVDELGEGLAVEARSAEDGIVEGLRLRSQERYVLGVQWHPEFQDPSDGWLLEPMPVFEDFLEAVDERRRDDRGERGDASAQERRSV